MEGKMSAIDMQSACGLEGGTDLRNAARLGHSLRYSADSRHRGPDEGARGAGSSSRTPTVKHESAHGQPRRSPSARNRLLEKKKDIAQEKGFGVRQAPRRRTKRNPAVGNQSDRREGTEMSKMTTEQAPLRQGSWAGKLRSAVLGMLAVVGIVAGLGYASQGQAQVTESVVKIVGSAVGAATAFPTYEVSNYELGLMFRTGNDIGGYKLDNVQVYLASNNAAADPVLTLNASTSVHYPNNTVITTLQNPATVTTGLKTFVTFTDPNRTKLEPLTTYGIVVKTGTSGNRLVLTARRDSDATQDSDEQTTGGAIRSSTAYRNNSTNTWSIARVYQRQPIMQVRGVIINLPPEMTGGTDIVQLAENSGETVESSPRDVGEPYTVVDPEGETVTYSLYGAENWEHRDNNVTIDSTGQLKTKVGAQRTSTTKRETRRTGCKPSR